MMPHTEHHSSVGSSSKWFHDMVSVRSPSAQLVSFCKQQPATKGCNHSQVNVLKRDEALEGISSLKG